MVFGLQGRRAGHDSHADGSRSSRARVRRSAGGLRRQAPAWPRPLRNRQSLGSRQRDRRRRRSRASGRDRPPGTRPQHGPRRMVFGLQFRWAGCDFHADGSRISRARVQRSTCGLRRQAPTWPRPTRDRHKLLRADPLQQGLWAAARARGRQYAAEQEGLHVVDHRDRPWLPFVRRGGWEPRRRLRRGPPCGRPQLRTLRFRESHLLRLLRSTSHGRRRSSKARRPKQQRYEWRLRRQVLPWPRPLQDRHSSGSRQRDRRRRRLRALGRDRPPGPRPQHGPSWKVTGLQAQRAGDAFQTSRSENCSRSENQQKRRSAGGRRRQATTWPRPSRDRHLRSRARPPPAG